MSRRGENIYHRRDGRWEGRYIKGRKQDGKPCFGSVYGYSYSEVKKKLMPLKAAYYEKGVDRRYTKPFRDYLLARLEAQRSSGIKSSSYDSYFCIVHNHLLPAFGQCPMHRLTTPMVQDFLCGLRQKGLADGTIRNIFRYLNSAVQHAVKSGMMEQDICANIVLLKAKTKTIHALSRAEQSRLERAALNTLRDSNASRGAEVMLALYTGMRVGEICALRWSDIDFDCNLIRVRHSMQRIKSHDTRAKTAVALGSPKSSASLREIPMNTLLSTLLRNLRKHAKGDYVITGRSQYAEPRVVQYRFARMLEQAQLLEADVPQKKKRNPRSIVSNLLFYAVIIGAVVMAVVSTGRAFKLSVLLFFYILFGVLLILSLSLQFFRNAQGERKISQVNHSRKRHRKQRKKVRTAEKLRRKESPCRIKIPT